MTAADPLAGNPLRPLTIESFMKRSHAAMESPA